MLFRRHSRKNLDKNELKRVLESWIQEKCIFFQKPLICFGELQNYIIDDTNLEISLNSMPIPGLENPRESFLLSSAWEDLALLPAHLISYDQGWHLFFESELIEEIQQTAIENESRQARLLKIMEILLNYLAKEGK